MTEDWKERIKELVTRYGPERVKVVLAEMCGEKPEVNGKFTVSMEGAEKVMADLEALTAVAEMAVNALGALGQDIEIKVNRLIPLDWFPVVNPMAVQDTLNRLDERRAKLQEAQNAKELAYKGYRKAEADVDLARAEAAMNIPAEYNKNDQGRKAWEKKGAAKEIEALAAKQDAKDCADSDYSFALDDLRAVEAKADLQGAVIKYLTGGVK